MKTKKLRVQSLINLVQDARHISIKDAAEQLNVSEMTIRRDVRDLGGQAAVYNFKGELISANSLPNPNEPVYQINDELRVRESLKQRIGLKAASLIENDDVIIIDTGTTTDRIIPALPDNIHAAVLCYNLNILYQVSRNSNLTILFAGGNFHPNSQMFECPEGIEYIRTVRANKAFISAAGVHDKLGLTCRNVYEVPTKNAILESAAEHILVADSSKFGAVRSSYFTDLSNIQTIVTDQGLSDEWTDIITQMNITLYKV